MDSCISPRNPLWEPAEDNLLHSHDDPLLPWLRCIKRAFDNDTGTPEFDSNFYNLLEECTRTFQNEDRYQNDIRFVKIWILYADACQSFETVFKTVEENGIGLQISLFYEAFAVSLELKGKLIQAHSVYQLAISRNAQPLDRLKILHRDFLSRVAEVSNVSHLQKIETGRAVEDDSNYRINPWSTSTISALLKKMNSHIVKYNGYFKSTKDFSGRIPLSSLPSTSRNKMVELGGIKYHIKGCSGKGGFAQVFKACLESNPKEVVALKIQLPAFPWEFYMYRQLDKRIPDEERSSFGFAEEVHIYSDCSILVCDYLAHGTLQDAINSKVVIGQNMEEVICIYYTIEMLRMLETLHNVGIIHGDFKPDNLLVRYARDDLNVDEFVNRSGAWRDQGLCLVDWGRGIDLSLFPDGTMFGGDCRTSSFRCVEMQEKRPWVFQVDTYGLCAVVHIMLHGKYMNVEKKVSGNGSYLYQPRSSLRRYWQEDLWKSLFTTLLNMSCSNDVMVLQSLRKSFEEYLYGSPKLIKSLKESIMKQRSTMCCV